MGTVVYLAESCAADVEAYCAETPMGEGRILACLEAQSDELSDTCRTVIDEIVISEE